MNVVWHKAVRKNGKRFVNRRAQKSLVHRVNAFVRQEDLATFERAEREEVSMGAKVIEGLEMFRLAGDQHSAAGKSNATVVTRRRGPAKAGHYARHQSG
jgi:hypothetical protein